MPSLRSLLALTFAPLAACTVDFTNDSASSAGGAASSTSSTPSTTGSDATSSGTSGEGGAGLSTSSSGIGSSSSGGATCATTTCDPNATCAEPNGVPTCTCNQGYQGDGASCALIPVGAPGLVIIDEDRANTPDSAVTLTLQEPRNLLVNAGGDGNGTTGWNVLQGGGSGWANASGDPTLHLFGPTMFFTSFANATKTQTVDLVAQGFSAAELDGAPPILAREWVHGGGYETDDAYWLTVELRSGTNDVLATYTQGTVGNPVETTNGWVRHEHHFTGYPSGVRSIVFTHGGKDTEYWQGHYGPAMDGASVSVGSVMMRLSNDGQTWSNWVPFTSTAQWSLANGSGQRTVHVQYQDALGAIWPPVTDSVVVQ